MRISRNFTLVAGLLLGMSSQAPAQFSLNIGGPTGIQLGNPANGVASSYTTYGNGLGYGVGSGYSNYGGVGLGTGGYGINSGYSNFGGIGLGTGAYGINSGYSSYGGYGGYGSGLGYYNNSVNYSNTGYLAGPGVIGGRYGYNSGYAGVAPVGAYPGVVPGYGTYGYGARVRTNVTPFRANRFGWLR